MTRFDSKLFGRAAGPVLFALILAFGPSELMQRALAGPLPAHTRKTSVSHAKLSEEIKRVRMQGWSSAPDQLVLGMNAIAGPVFQHDGTLAGMLGVCGLTQFVPHPPPAELIDQLTTACWRASRNQLAMHPNDGLPDGD